ncbi:MAG: TolC family protein, partial [Pseudomonadota bacterium]|nr:TolC family protein [Pseudomonadota bacterium]
MSSAVLALCPWQAAQAESLFEAVEKTLANHPRQESAMLRLEAAADKRREEKSAFFPTLSGNAAGGRVYGDNSTSRGLSVTRGSGYSWLWEGDIALTQNLFNGMGTVNRHSAAIDREEAAKYSMDDVREMLTIETVNAYMDVLRAEDSLRYIAEYKAALEKYRPQFKVLIDQGAVDSTDQSQAFDMIARASKLENDFNAQKQSAIARYAMMTGHEPQGELHAPKVVLNI